MDENVRFSGQITPEQVREVAALGFKSIINNRPDYEEGAHQPTAASIAEAAAQLGLTYIIQPVVSGSITELDVHTFAEHVNQSPKPILAFCRTGNRCNNLFQMAKQLDLLDD